MLVGSRIEHHGNLFLDDRSPALSSSNDLLCKCFPFPTWVSTTCTVNEWLILRAVTMLPSAFYISKSKTLRRCLNVPKWGEEIPLCPYSEPNGYCPREHQPETLLERFQHSLQQLLIVPCIRRASFSHRWKCELSELRHGLGLGLRELKWCWASYLSREQGSAMESSFYSNSLGPLRVR